MEAPVHQQILHMDKQQLSYSNDPSAISRLGAHLGIEKELPPLPGQDIYIVVGKNPTHKRSDRLVHTPLRLNYLQSEQSVDRHHLLTTLLIYKFHLELLEHR